MKCAICNHEFSGFGNNPWPIRTNVDARCCDACNTKYVIVGRFALRACKKSSMESIAESLNKFSQEQLNVLFTD